MRDADGVPLSSATVQVADALVGATTDAEGRFRLADVPAGAQTVEVRFVGYATVRRLVTVEPERTTTLEMTLSEVAVGLDQVVVTAQKREERLVDVSIAVLPLPLMARCDGRTLRFRNRSIDPSRPNPEQP